MAIPNIKKINTCTAIQYASHVINKVFYSDSNSLLHQIWPSSTVIEDLSIVKLDPRGQEYDTAEVYLENNGEPLVRLLPDTDYAVKGTINNYENGQVVSSITNCYLTTETIGSQSQYSASWSIYSNDNVSHGGNTSVQYTNRKATYNNTDTNGVAFTVFRCDDGVYGGDPFCTPQMHYVSSNFASITGFVFDDNYKSPLVLKRITIQQELKFYDANSGGNEITGTYSIERNTTGRLYTKLVKVSPTNSSWHDDDLPVSTSNYTYTISQGCDATVTAGADYVDINVGTTGGYVEFTYNTNVTKTLYIAPITNAVYSLWANGNPINTTASNPIVLTQPFTFSIRDVNANDYYTGSNYSFSITDGDSSAVTISGKTISPSRDPSKYGATATISGTVEGVGVNNAIHVEIGNIVTYYKAGPLIASGSSATINGNMSTLSSTNSVTWSSPSSGDVFGIELYEDSLGSTVIPIYCDPLSTAPFYGSLGTDNRLVISYNGSGNNSITIPIYTDSTKTVQLGSITITTS